MTPQKTPQGEPGTPYYPMGLNRFDGIMGATRIKATMVSEQRADQILVATEETN